MRTQKELRRKKRMRNYFFKLTKFSKLSRAKNLLDNFSDFFWKIPCLVKSWQGEGKKKKRENIGKTPKVFLHTVNH